MTITTSVVSHIPESTFRQGPGRSVCVELVEKARSAKTRKIKVTSDLPSRRERDDELGKLYRTFTVWKSRHKNVRVNLRKVDAAIYVWIPEDGETPDESLH